MSGENNLGEIIRERRIARELTLQELANMSGVSLSHLGRTEKGERFPSIDVLRKIAKPLDYGVLELLVLAGYITPGDLAEQNLSYYRLAPDVVRALSEEPIEAQQAVLKIINIIKSLTL